MILLNADRRKLITSLIHEHFQLHQTSIGVARKSELKHSSESYERSRLNTKVIDELQQQSH
jgi:hypothetical protein